MKGLSVLLDFDLEAVVLFLQSNQELQFLKEHFDILRNSYIKGIQ